MTFRISHRLRPLAVGSHVRILAVSGATQYDTQRLPGLFAVITGKTSSLSIHRWEWRCEVGNIPFLFATHELEAL